MITFIGNVNLDRLAYLGKTISFPKKLFVASHIAVFLLFLSGLSFLSIITARYQISYLATAGCLVYFYKADGDKSCKTRRRKDRFGENQ